MICPQEPCTSEPMALMRAQYTQHTPRQICTMTMVTNHTSLCGNHTEKPVSKKSHDCIAKFPLLSLKLRNYVDKCQGIARKFDESWTNNGNFVAFEKVLMGSHGKKLEPAQFQCLTIACVVNSFHVKYNPLMAHAF